MRPRTAAAVWVVALALGGGVGLAGPPLDEVFPTGRAGSSTPAATSVTTSPSTDRPTPRDPVTPSTGTLPSTVPSPTPSTPPTRADLLSVRSFADVSVEVVDQSPDKPDRTIDATSCVSDDVHTTSTLRKVTGHDPVLEGDWAEVETGDGARQQLAVADDEEDARQSVTELAVSLQACEEATPGHYVVGPASTQDLSPTRSATWVGYYPDAANRTGRAPTGTEPCGGTLLARNGARFTVVVVSLCLDGAQLASLAETASERLG